MRLNPNEAVSLWISIVLGREKYAGWYFRLALMLLLPLLPISWILWWAAYAVMRKSS